MAKISLWTAHKQRTGYNGLAKEAELSVSGNFYVRERPSKDDTLYLSRVYSPSCYSLIDIPLPLSLPHLRLYAWENGVGAADGEQQLESTTFGKYRNHGQSFWCCSYPCRYYTPSCCCLDSHWLQLWPSHQSLAHHVCFSLFLASLVTHLWLAWVTYQGIFMLSGWFTRRCRRKRGMDMVASAVCTLFSFSLVSIMVLYIFTDLGSGHYEPLYQSDPYPGQYSHSPMPTPQPHLQAPQYYGATPQYYGATPQYW